MSGSDGRHDQQRDIIKDPAESYYMAMKLNDSMKAIDDPRLHVYRQGIGKDAILPFVYEMTTDRVVPSTHDWNSFGDNILVSPFQHFHKDGQTHRGAHDVTFGDKRDVRGCGFNVVNLHCRNRIIEVGESPADFLARRKEVRGQLYHAAKNAFDGRGFLVFADMHVFWLAPLESPIIFPDAQQKALWKQVYDRWIASQKAFVRSISIPEEFWSINQPNLMTRVPLAGTIAYSSDMYIPPVPVTLWEGDI